MKKIIFQDGHNHLVSPRVAGDGYTFCGLCFQFIKDDTKSFAVGATLPAITDIVDCPDCIELIEWARGVRIKKGG